MRLWDLHIPREKRLNYLQTVETLIRRRILRRLIWVCNVCQLPFYRSPDYNGLKSLDEWQTVWTLIRRCSPSAGYHLWSYTVFSDPSVPILRIITVIWSNQTKDSKFISFTNRQLFSEGDWCARKLIGSHKSCPPPPPSPLSPCPVKNGGKSTIDLSCSFNPQICTTTTLPPPPTPLWKMVENLP